MVYRNHTMDEDEFEYYLFEKNLQGDIVAVYDEYGFAAVTYTYDAWGNVTETLYDTTSNGQYNSFRYRGYFYDEETGLYYLNSRYYDPAIGRFLNADVYVSTGTGFSGYNMFAYCDNNPVKYTDELGYNWFSSWCEDVSNWWEDTREWMDKYLLNADGSYSLHDSDRFENPDSFHDQVLAVKASGPSYDLLEGNLGLGSLSSDFLTAGWEGENWDLSLFDLGHAEISAEVKNGDLSLGAKASIWSPSISFELFGFTIELGAELGSVGGEINTSKNGFQFSASSGWGISFGISW